MRGHGHASDAASLPAYPTIVPWRDAMWWEDIDSTGLMPSDHLFSGPCGHWALSSAQNMGALAGATGVVEVALVTSYLKLLHVHDGNPAAPMHPKLGTGAASRRVGRNIGYLTSRNSFPWCAIR
jgi:hypothetical protein